MVPALGSTTPGARIVFPDGSRQSLSWPSDGFDAVGTVSLGHGVVIWLAVRPSGSFTGSSARSCLLWLDSTQRSYLALVTTVGLPIRDRRVVTRRILYLHSSVATPPLL